MRRLISLLVTAALFTDAAWAGVQIRLHDEAELLTAHYRLGDIAAVTVEGDARLQQELSRLVVGKSPRPGYWGHVTRRQLGAQIDRAFPGVYNRLDWSGAAKARIKAGGVPFSGDKLAQAAEAYLLSRLGAGYERFSVGLIEPAADLLLPQGAVTLTPKLVSERPGKRLPVQVDIEVEGEPYQTATVWFSVSVFAEVLTAKRDLPALSAVDGSAFKREYRDIAALQDSPVVEFAALDGMRLQQPLSKGEALSSDMLEPMPAVVKGQQVAVFAAAGKVTLRTTAVALSDGDMAQQIRVQRVKDSINYPATVIGRGQVRVD